MRPVSLSGRLRAAAAMVTAGSRVCDVGCDHGFVPIYLVEQGVSPRVLAMDVRSGPLGAAREHIAERGLESRIETRLSDGLHNYNIGEADTLVCAGMGGGLMLRILSADKEKTASFRELILQPQSEIERFRAGLREMGYRIVDEKMIEEDGKFYPMMRAVFDLCKPSHFGAEDKNNDSDLMLCKLQDRYGAILLERKDRTLLSYLKREERIYTEILDGLRAQGAGDAKRERRYAEVSELLAQCRTALRMVSSDEDSRCAGTQDTGQGEGEDSYGYDQD